MLLQRTRVNKMLHLTLLIRGGGGCCAYLMITMMFSNHNIQDEIGDLIKRRFVLSRKKNVLSQSRSTCKVFPKLKKLATMARARVITKETH